MYNLISKSGNMFRYKTIIGNFVIDLIILFVLLCPKIGRVVIDFILFVADSICYRNC